MARSQTLRMSRRAVAPLELALCLPVLLTLIVGIVWLGFSVVGQSEVAVQARQAAWEQRFEAQGTALLFLADDLVSEKAVGKITVTPLLDDMAPPSSAHDVMVGSWDHHELSLDRTPNLKEYALAAVNAKTGSVQVGYTDATNQFNGWKKSAQDTWRTLGQSLLRELTNMGSLAESILGAAQQEQSDTSPEKAQLDEQIAQLKADIQRTKGKQRRLEKEKVQADSDEAKKSRMARIELQKNKVKRLENDLRRLNPIGNNSTKQLDQDFVFFRGANRNHFPPKIIMFTNHTEPTSSCPPRNVHIAIASGVVLVCAGVVSSLASFGLSHQDRFQSAAPFTTSQAAFPAPPAPGYWTFADCPWQVQTTHVSVTDVIDRLSSIERLAGPFDISRQPDASELVELARAYGLQRTSYPSRVIYRSDGANLRMRLVTNDTSSPRLIAAAVAIKSQGSVWELHEVQPATDCSTHSRDNLLPLPVTAERTCSRRSADGDLLLEFVTLEASADQLLPCWREAGWQVQRSVWGRRNRFSYLCVRGDDVVYAWSATADRPHELLLSKSQDVVLPRSRFQ